ncbi:hypothetical protein BGX34_002476 [Mortierella sp. NVP85]|nr:hypothetical protein BGX34_002476 [Mortierella sp. NVP85]
MSDDNNSASTAGQAVDPVRQLLQENNANGGASGQALTADQRNERREALLKRQRESREKAQQLAQSARANATSGSAAPAATAAATTTTTPSPVPASTTTPAATTAATPAAAPVAAAAPAPAPAADAPVRENMVQQAVSFLSSPSVQSAEESKKIQFLEKKGLTAKEIELARARVAGSVSAPAVSAAPQTTSYQPSPAPASSSPVPPPVPPRNYAPMQPYPQPVYIQQQQPVPVDPNAFKRKMVMAMLISGGVTVLTSILVQKLIYPVVRGITGARQTLAVSQTDLLSKLKEKLLGYKEYLQSLNLGSNRAPVKKIKDTKTVVEEVEDESEPNGLKKSTTTTTTTTTVVATKDAKTTAPYQSTVKQLDAFSEKLKTHANSLNFEELKATRAVTQDLAEYITKETYALTSSIAYPMSRYYGNNTAGAAASGKGGLADSTSPEALLKSEIKSLKGMLINWRNFPVAGAASPGVGAANGLGALPNLVQQQ